MIFFDFHSIAESILIFWLSAAIRQTKRRIRLLADIKVHVDTNARDWFFCVVRCALRVARCCASCCIISYTTCVAGRAQQCRNLRVAKELCKEHKITFKMNTVVCSLNWREDMNELIDELEPGKSIDTVRVARVDFVNERARIFCLCVCVARWKVFQVLVLKGENDGDNKASALS